MENINLIPQAVAQQAEKKNLNKSINVSSIVALLVVAAILLALFGYQVFLSSTATRIDRQTEEIEAEINQQNEKEVTHRALVSKLEESEKFLDSRLVYSSAYNAVAAALTKAKVTLTEGTLEVNGDFSISAESVNTSRIGVFVEELKKLEENGVVSKLELVSLTKEIDPNDEGPPFKFTIDYDYSNKGLFTEEQNSGEGANE